MTATKINYSQLNLNPPQGYMINGKIAVSVVSNNLTVAIKTLAGNDPSPADPVMVRIGDAVRLITAALSVTKNAGVNYGSAGSAEFATKEIDYFVYLHYSNSTVRISFSRIPYALNFNDFSGFGDTTQKTCNINDSTGWAAVDPCEVVGRFAATLSAGAGYTWSVPTFTNINLIQRPIYESRWLNFTSVPTGFSVNPTYYYARYKVVGDTVRFAIDTGDGGTSNSTSFSTTLPFTSSNNYNGQVVTGLCGIVCDGGTWDTSSGKYAKWFVGNNSQTLSFALSSITAGWTASSLKRTACWGQYEIT